MNQEYALSIHLCYQQCLSDSIPHSYLLVNRRILAKADEVIILDVRQPNEYRQGHIPGATLIPLPELSARLGEIDPEKPVLVY